MLPPILTYKHAGLYVDVRYDEDAGNPRDENDNLGTIVGWKSPNLRIGDRQASIECRTPDELVSEMRAAGARLLLPIFYTSHGPRCHLYMGEDTDKESLSHSSGVVFVTAEKLRAEYGVTRITAATTRKATAVVQAEIAEYSAYLTGDVFGFTIRDLALNELDCGFGFYSQQECEEAGSRQAEHCAADLVEEAQEVHEMACRDIPTSA